jgi:excisionase family DNA binding protein
MSTDYAQGEKLLTKGEVAQMCRVEIRTVDRWVAAGKLVYYRTPGGRLLFRKNDVLMAGERGVDAPRSRSLTIRRARRMLPDIVGHVALFTTAVLT